MKKVKIASEDLSVFNTRKDRNSLDLALDIILNKLPVQLRFEAVDKGFMFKSDTSNQFNVTIPNASVKLEKALQKIFRSVCFVGTE
jgi:hypothetical protein